MWEMPYEFDKRIKYMGNDVNIREMAKIFLKFAAYGAQLKHLRNGISMLQIN